MSKRVRKNINYNENIDNNNNNNNNNNDDDSDNEVKFIKSSGSKYVLYSISNPKEVIS